MTEGVEWNTFEVEIGKAFGDVVLVLRRDAVETGEDGVGQVAAGVVFTEESACYGSASGFAGIPGVEDGGKVVVGPGDGERPGVHEDENGFRVGGIDGFEELLLCTGQIE